MKTKNIFTIMSILTLCGCMENISLNNPTGKTPQVINSDMGIYGFNPNIIQLKRDTPIVWNLNVLSLNACTDKVIIEGIGEYKLKEGANKIEFTAPAPGEIKFACGMNMLEGKFIVQ